MKTNVSQIEGKVTIHRSTWHNVLDRMRQGIKLDDEDKLILAIYIDGRLLVEDNGVVKKA